MVDHEVRTKLTPQSKKSLPCTSERCYQRNNIVAVPIYDNNQATYESRVYPSKFSFRHAWRSPWLIPPSDLRSFCTQLFYLFIYLIFFFHGTNLLRHISQQSSLPPRLLSTLSSKYARIVLQTEEICENTRKMNSLEASCLQRTPKALSGKWIKLTSKKP